MSVPSPELCAGCQSEPRLRPDFEYGARCKAELDARFDLLQANPAEYERLHGRGGPPELPAGQELEPDARIPGMGEARANISEVRTAEKERWEELHGDDDWMDRP